MNKELSANTTLSHYRIVSKLGAGGMGEVWLAEDTRLGRKVALKLLPAKFTEDSERVRRFTLEAKAASALNHPNIIAVHDIGECETGRFIVMEFVAGRTLRSVIAKDNSLETFFTLGAQMAKALSAAHAAGITHRDIKPDNIMVRDDGYVKMLDFGLARLLPTTGSDPEAMTLAQQTTPGTVMGTLAYMSPEQASGQTVGSPSDVFALGIVLYELATGSHPFKSETMIGYLHAITSQVPPSMTSLKSHLPPALDDLILRMLEKDANSRPMASEVAQALQDIEKYGSSNTLPIRVAPVKHKAKREEEAFWIAVLPFKVRDNDPDVGVLADGLAEEIVTGLSRFRYLSVVTTAAGRVKGETENDHALRAKLGTRYVLEGSIRKGGSVIRVSAQLVDTETGAQLWSETYTRDLQTSTIFDVQDDVAGRIVATVADSYGVLVHSMAAAIRKKDDADLTSAEWQFQYFAYREQITPANHAALKSRLERAAKSDNRPSDLWACLAQIYLDEYAFGFPGNDGTSLERALVAARRAVELDRANQFAMVALAQTHFFRQDLAAFGPAAERAMALNPLNTDALGILGLEIVHTAEFERGTAIVRHAMELNPNHAGWMHFAPLWNHFHKGEYEQALECANRVDVPGLFWPYLVMASACGHLGRRAEAQAAVRDLLALDPQFAAHARSYVGTWHFASGLLDPILEGLRKAGLEISDAGPASTSSTPRLASVETRADEGFWVAVLPFKFTGSNTEVATLAEGLSEEIVTGLSRFSYLRVISRSSTLRYATETSDVRTVGNALGARYVLEGSLRIAGTSLRVSVQLVDANTGSHLWVETYKRSFSSDDIFALQDDLASRIVSTIADMNGVLPHTMGEMLRQRDSTTLTPYEVVLRAFAYVERLNAEEHAEVRSALERAEKEAPNQPDCLAMLALAYVDEHKQGFNVQPDSLDRAFAVAQRAVAAAPSNHIAHAALAQILFFRRDLQGFRSAADRAVALNPMDAYTTAFMGILIAYSGDWEYGCALAEKGMELNPNHPGWYRFCSFFREYRKHDYRAALDIALKMNMPSYHYTHGALAAAYGQLGELENARTALRELLALMPDVATEARELYQKWFGPGELLEDVLDGLRKAGLEIVEADSSLASSNSGPLSSETRADEGFWVAVLPFKATGTDAELSTLAEGLSDEIVTGLNRFSYLRVIARSSTHRYSSQTSDVRSVGKALGARYVMEGNVRQAGSLIRVTVQLVDANTGAHLWAETYDRAFKPDEIFALQDDLVPRIVSTVADQHGVLPHSMSEVLRARDPDQLTAYETLLRGFRYYEGVTATEHATIRASLERALETSPGSADCWAMLSIMYCDEHKFGFNQLPDSLGRALNAAQRAVEISQTNPFAYEALSQALFFRKEFDSFRNAAERAIALNPMDGATNAFMGILIAFTGDWDYGCAVAERATQLNPHHPGWYWNAAFYNAYRQRDYESALKITLEFNMPGLFYHHVNRAAVYGQLRERKAASKAIADLLALKPDFGSTARDELGKWLRPELVDHVIEGLRRAGLEIGEAGVAPTTSTSTPVSSVSRSDEGFWIAVLPFKFTGSNTEVATLADGLSEEIVTGLSRFSYLRVISRSSTLRYVNETDDVRTVGKTLGARYVMEGSLRIAGASLRVSVQLIDASTGAHLWAETYDRQFRAAEVFALQDDLVPRIVSTVADVNGVLPRSMCDVVCNKDPDQLSPYEAVLRSFRYFDRVTAEELAAAQSCLEVAIQRSPTNADAWAMLALLFAQDYGEGFNVHSDALNSSAVAAQRAVEAGPSNHLAHFALAQARFFQKEFQSFRNAAERAIALNPMDANSVAFLGELLTYVGDSERGLALAARAKEISPNHPGWFWYVDFFHAYRLGDYDRALNLILKANLPGHWGMHAGIAAAAAQLGNHEAAAKAVRDLLKVRPDFCATARASFEKWFDPELRERFIDGLRRAGLEIAGEEEAVRQVSDEKRSDLLKGEPTVANDKSFTVNAKSAFTSAASNSGFGRPAIVVLPFVNRSPDPDNEYFSDGLTEEIISDLSVIKALRVISRNSSMSFKGTAKDTLSIGKDLGVSHIVSGSVRKAGDDLRITVELVEVAGDTPLWSDKFSGTIANIFGFQEEISRKIVSALQVRLTEAETQVIAERPIDNAAAYDCYMRARHEIYLFTAEGLDRAQKLVDSGLSLIGENSLLLATRGLVSWYYLNFSIRPEAKYLDEADAYATKALMQDPHNAHGIFLRGLVAAKRGDIESTLRDLRIAREQRPGDSMVLNELIRHLTSAGQELNESSRSAFDESLRLDPLHPLNWAQLAWRRFNAGRLAESADAARRILQLTDRGNPARVYAAFYLAIAHMPEDAINLFDEEGAALAGTAYGSISLFLSSALQGNAEAAVKHVTPQLEQAATWTEYLALFLADGYSLLGDRDLAMKWLRAAVAQGFINYPYLAARDPFLVNVRSDPRFAELIRKVKPRWQALAQTPIEVKQATDGVEIQEEMSEHLDQRDQTGAGT